MTATALPVANSHAALSDSSPIGRVPRAPRRPRLERFASMFDPKTLFYDCFWHADDERILLVGPPPYGINYKNVKFTAGPSNVRLDARFFASVSVMVTELSGAPEGTTTVRFELAGERFELAVHPSSVAELKGRRVLFSINKDNDLAWIREWAEYHARAHGTDAVILFDNASTRYDVTEVHGALASVPGISHVGVPSWPYRFGPFDPAVVKDPYWGRFLQIGSMSVVLRRYGEAAYGLLDCDIDELAGTRSGRSIYDLAHDSKGGLVAFRGSWIEAVGQGERHRDFRQRLADPEAAHSPQRKWALDPSRPWVRRLSVHPYWHWVAGRSLFAKSMPDDALYWHFKPINTNWKQARTAPAAGATIEDNLLATTLRRAGLVT